LIDTLTRWIPIWPVIVTAGDLLQSELLWDYVEQNVEDRLKQRQVQALTLVDLDDFELLVGFVEGGLSLVDVLRRKSESPFRKLDLNQGGLTTQPHQRAVTPGRSGGRCLRGGPGTHGL